MSESIVVKISDSKTFLTSWSWKRQSRHFGDFFLYRLWVRLLVGRFSSTRDLATNIPNFQFLSQNRVRAMLFQRCGHGNIVRLNRTRPPISYAKTQKKEKCQSTCSGVCKWFVGECAAKTKFENLNHNIGRKELQKPRHVFHWKRTRRESTQDYKLLNHCVACTCIEYFFSRVTCVVWKLGLNSSPKLEVVCKKHKQGNSATKSSIYTRIYFSYTLVSPRRG